MAATSDEQLIELLDLIRHSDTVELKLTVPLTEQRATLLALGLDPLDAQIRLVYFFETPELALQEAGVVVRARRVQRKGDDSVVKLRPVVPQQLPAELRELTDFGVEVDAMPGGYVCSGWFKGVPPQGLGCEHGAQSRSASSSRRSSARSSPSPPRGRRPRRPRRRSARSRC